ncbi:MAG: hypothetical protein WCS97_03325 [Candidatus Paceibacterota bacterium]
MVSSQNKTRSCREVRARNEESCREDEGERAIVVPMIIGIVPIAVEPLTIIVAIRIQHVRVAIGIRDLYARSSMPPPIEYSPS